MAPSPLGAVNAQLDAYNARDIDAFARVFADDVIAADLDSGEIRFRGSAALRERYALQFKANPLQRASVVTRSVLADYVFDLEFVTGSADRPDAHIMAIYRVKDGRIDRVWFSPRVPAPSQATP